MSHRLLPVRNPAMEALLEERDHLRIQISLLSDSEVRDHQRLKDLIGSLAQLEEQISSSRQGRA